MSAYLDQIKTLLDQIQVTDHRRTPYPYDSGIECAVELVRDCKREKRCLYICGNGGSAGIAQHMTADFMKNGGVRTCSLYGQPTITCISNDLTYEYVFCKQLEILADAGDVLIAVSSSGESGNIVKAIGSMQKLGGRVITLTGFEPQNRIRSMGDFNIYVPASHYGLVESIHNLILQQMVDIIMKEDGVAMKL